MDLNINNKIFNLNKRLGAKYQGGFEVSNVELDNVATRNRMVTRCNIQHSICFLVNEYFGGKNKAEQDT
jgi:hypothetical protein